jgi:hypothetical protein
MAITDAASSLLPPASLAIWPANARKEQFARARNVNESLIAQLGPRHHPSIHPSINRSLGRRWLQFFAKLFN